MGNVAGDPGRIRSAPIPAAAYWALFVLTLANVLNYADRQILSILGQSIKTDLGLDDAQLGFLLGTAFAIIYSVVGIAMGGIADRLSRKRLMAFGLLLWSGMTALGGAATGFTLLSLARIGVGVGEAAAVPCAQSLVSDIFPPRRRALALGVYVAASSIGTAVAMILGGYFLANWQDICSAVPIAGSCAIAGWQAALFAIGLPGIPVALLLLTIREPARKRDDAGVLMVVVRQLAAALPPVNLFALYGIGGIRALRANAILGAGIFGLTWLLVWTTDDFAQWAALGFGAYALVTWGHIQRLRDTPLFALTLGDPTFMLGTGSTAVMSCMFSAIVTWTAPFALRTYSGLSQADLGLGLGFAHPVGGVLGVLVGSWLTDKWKLRDRRAPLWMGAISVVGSIPFIVAMLLVQDIRLFFVLFFTLGVVSALWSGASPALTQDLVLPRMRGAAAASYSLIVLVITFGMGPYWVGKVSQMTGDLRTGMFSILLLAPVALAMHWFGARRLLHASPEARMAKAIAAGEPT